MEFLRCLVREIGPEGDRFHYDAMTLAFGASSGIQYVLRSEVVTVPLDLVAEATGTGHLASIGVNGLEPLGKIAAANLANQIRRNWVPGSTIITVAEFPLVGAQGEMVADLLSKFCLTIFEVYNARENLIEYTVRVRYGIASTGMVSSPFRERAIAVYERQIRQLEATLVSRPRP